MSGGVLDGRRVVVTRAIDQAAALSNRLVALGAEVIELPTIAVVEADDDDLEDALLRLASFDWLVVTSPNGARRVAAALAGCDPGRPQVAAVGSATASALGRPADLVPANQIAEGLLAEFPRGSGRVLIAQADEARPVLEAGLTESGWHVRTVTTHRTIVAPADVIGESSWIEEKKRALDADALLFTSGSAARGWAATVGSWTPGIVVAIGPATAAVGRQENLKITHVAADHSLDGVVATLVDAVGDPA